MTNTKPIVDLDFDRIKTDIIAFIRTNPTFTDYNFEGAALNAIADMLAYNTHNMAYYANMLHSEGFLDTAQKRSSVVSRAKELGYTPRSATCSTAFIDLTVFGVPSNSAPPYLERGTPFTTINDSGRFIFYVETAKTSELIDGAHEFSQIKLVNGALTNNYFTVNTTVNVRSIFTIPNKGIDTSTLRVYVRENLNAFEREEYFLAENIYELTADSKSFFLQESYDGNFQIYFGNNVIGKQPTNGNVIDVDYFVVENYASADNCRTFNLDANISLATSINVLTTQVSFGGADKETLDSIKYNAIKSNSAKERTVTANDYSLVLKEKFNFIKSAAVWGGEDNIPPVYGKVFVSIQPVSGYTISDSVKNDVILPELRKNSMLTIRPELVDPSYISIEFNTKIKFNPYKTVRPNAAVEALVKASIVNYVSDLSYFNSTFLESNLINTLSVIDSGIMSISLKKKIGFNITPLIGVSVNHTKFIDNEIVSGTISSNKFETNVLGISVVTIKEINSTAISNADGTIVKLGLYDDSEILISEIGYVNLTTGYFYITMNVNAYLFDIPNIAIRFELATNDVKISRNQILVLNSTISSVPLVINDNVVTTEIYAK